MKLFVVTKQFVSNSSRNSKNKSLENNVEGSFHGGIFHGVKEFSMEG